MTRIGSIKDIIKERGRWLQFEQEQANITKWEYFVLGLIVGVILISVIFLLFK